MSLGRYECCLCYRPAVQDPPLTPAEKLRVALAALEAAIERLAVSFDRVAALLHAAGDPRSFGPSRTGDVPLPGGTARPEVLAAAALSRDGHGLSRSALEHLADRYGSRLDELLGLVARDRRLGEPLVASLPERRAEVVEAVESEWALTLEDVLRRRTQVALKDGAAGTDVAGEVATLMAEALGWDRNAARAAAEDYVRAVRASRTWR